MTIKAMLKLTLATTFLGLTLLAIVAMNDATESASIRVAETATDTNIDSNVRPAAAEIDLMAKQLKSKKNRVRTAHYETATMPNQEDGVMRDSQVQLCQGVDCGCQGTCGCSGSVGNAAFMQPMAQPTMAYADQASFGYNDQASFGYARPAQEQLPSKSMYAVDKDTRSKR